jgi:hypothetical protein
MPRLVALCAAAVVAVVAPAPAATSASAESLTIRLTSTVSGVRQVDKAPKGRPNRGDMVTITCVLQNRAAQFGKPKGAVVGKDVTVVKFRSATKWTQTATVYLPGGTMKIETEPLSSKPQAREITLPVRGGTGRYVGATGTLYVRDIDARAGISINVYRLRLP